MKVIWWKVINKDKNGHNSGHKSKRHAVNLFSSPSTYCGCPVPDDSADVVAEISREITCKKCQRVLKHGLFA